MEYLKFIWIQTRDGSPTLWSNELGEAYRSLKGAFTESWVAFVGPALEHYRREVLKNRPVRQVGEFGLGTGTNWLLWNLILSLELSPHGEPLVLPEYFVIERDASAFEMGLAHFSAHPEPVVAFLLKHGFRMEASELTTRIAAFPRPRIFASIEEAIACGMQADLWFHDPFGYDVNPEGYSKDTMEKVGQVLAPQFRGLSYACNRFFQRTLRVIPQVELTKLETGYVGLKRERLEFFRA